MTPASKQTLDQLLTDCTLKLFESNEYPLNPTGACSDDGPGLAGDSIAAVVGYVADNLRGALAIIGAPKVVSASRPLAIKALTPTPDQEEVRDWAGELSNQLLGRVKSQLLRRGITFELATPITIFANELRMPMRRATYGSWLGFEGSEGTVAVRFALHGPSDWDLPPIDETAEAPQAEGEMLLF
jgi:CheY-specific phosphatase CheX